MSLMGQVCFAVLLLTTVTPLTEGLELKIHINPGSQRRTARDAVSTTACRDKQLIDRNSIELPGNLSMLNQRVSFYQSEYVTQAINTLLETSTVAGLESVSVLRVLEVLSNVGCSNFPHGGVVRDQFLGASPNDIDFKVDCNISLVLDVCRREWGEEFCISTVSAKQEFAHIGRPKSEALDFGDSSGEFYGPIRFLEYTVNSLVYWTNRSIIFDIARTGVEDVCCKIIRIPSDDDSRSSWDDWNDINNAKKLYRFWKLRVKGFTPFNNDTREFIVEEAQMAIERENPRGNGFKTFYCSTVYDGATYITEANICQVADSTTCTEKSSLAARYDETLRNDMTSAYIEELEIPACATAGAMLAVAMPKIISSLFFVAILYLVF